MTKSEYLSNSAKLLAVVSALLLVANFLVSFCGDTELLFSLGQKLSNLSFYVAMVLGFLAFNGEGIAYKRAREYKSKKFTTILKIFLVYAFVFRFFKTLVENALVKNGATDWSGLLTALFCAMLNAVASYGFLLTLVSLRYVFRDSFAKKLFATEAFSFLVGVVYNVFKLFNYVVVKYNFAGFNQSLNALFMNEGVLHTLCVLQYLLNFVMFVVVMRHYSRLAIGEQEAFKSSQEMRSKAKSIYKSDCVGIDTLDDDFS